MEGRRLASIFVWKNYQKSIYQVCVKERSRTERSSKDDAASLFSCQYLSCLVLSLSLVFFLSLRVSQERTPLPLLLPQLLLYWRHSLYWLRRANGMKLSADPQEADSWINSIIKQTLCSTTIATPTSPLAGGLPSVGLASSSGGGSQFDASESGSHGSSCAQRRTRKSTEPAAVQRWLLRHTTQSSYNLFAGASSQPGTNANLSTTLLLCCYVRSYIVRFIILDYRGAVLKRTADGERLKGMFRASEYLHCLRLSVRQ